MLLTLNEYSEAVHVKSAHSYGNANGLSMWILRCVDKRAGAFVSRIVSFHERQRANTSRVLEVSTLTPAFE
jgi:hypothetical protein